MISSLFIFHLLLSSISAQSSFDQDFEGNDFPYFNQVPSTNFRCDEQQWAGYYSDDEADCQVFHICVRQHNTLEQYSFLCPNETVFDQELLVCVWADSFDCGSAPSLYYRNEGIFEYFDDDDLDSDVGVSQRRDFSSEPLIGGPEGRALDTGISLPAIGKSLASTLQDKREKVAKTTQSFTGRNKVFNDNKVVSPTLSSGTTKHIPASSLGTTAESDRRKFSSTVPRGKINDKNIRPKPTVSQLKSTVSSNIKTKELVRDGATRTKQKSASSLNLSKKDTFDISRITDKHSTPKLSQQKEIGQITARKKVKTQPTSSSLKNIKNKVTNEAKRISQKTKPTSQRVIGAKSSLQQISPSRSLQTPFSVKKTSSAQSLKGTSIPSQLQAPNSKQISRGQNIRRLKTTAKEPKRARANAASTSVDKQSKQFQQASVAQRPNVDFAKKIPTSRVTSKSTSRTEKKEQRRKEPTRRKQVTTTAAPATVPTTRRTKKFKPTAATTLSTPRKLKKTGKTFQSTTSRQGSRNKPFDRKLPKPTPFRPTNVSPSRSSTSGLTAFDILHDLLKNVTVLRSKALLNIGDSSRRGNIRRNRKADVTGSKVYLNNQSGQKISKYTSSRGIPRISKKQNYKKTNSRRVSNSNFARANAGATKLYPNSKPSFQSQTSELPPSTSTKRVNKVKDVDHEDLTCVYNSQSNSFTGCKPTLASVPLEKNPTPSSYFVNSHSNRQSQNVGDKQLNSQSVPTEVSKILNVPSVGAPVTLPNSYLSSYPSEPFQTNQINVSPTLSSPKRFASGEKTTPVVIVSRADAASNEKNQKKVYINRIESKDDNKANVRIENPLNLELPKLSLAPLSTGSSSEAVHGPWPAYDTPKRKTNKNGENLREIEKSTTLPYGEVTKKDNRRYL